MTALGIGSKRPFDIVNRRLSADGSPSRHASTPRSLSRASPVSNLSNILNTNSAAEHFYHCIHQFTDIFITDASIVLLGARGTGKSTLGVIAATAFQRRLIDTDFAFKEATGQSTSAFRKTHGSSEYQRRAIEILRNVLHSNPTRCVIVCGLVSLSTDGQILLSEYGQTHPVIHILRDVDAIQAYLNVAERSKVAELLDATEKTFRASSNLEFFNQSDFLLFDPELSPGQRSPAPRPTLKKAERHFLKFLALATKIENIPALEEAYPLSRVRVDSRSFTYAVSVPLSQIMTSTLDIERLEEGADVFEMKVGKIERDKHGRSRLPSLSEVSEALAIIRRNTIVPILYNVKWRDRKAQADKYGPSPCYLDLVYHGLRLAPEFATLDLSLEDDEIREVVKRRGSTRLIAHLYSSEPWHSDFWINAYQRSQNLGLDIVRLCRPATCMEDNFAVEGFKAKINTAESNHIPLIAYNTGTLGRTSCCFNKIMTPVTHEDINTQGPESPRISAMEATRALYSSFVFEPMRFYIMGVSAGYSLSPAMHSAAYRACGMPHTYTTHQTPSVSELQALVNDPQFGGCSISLPFKLEVIALTHSLSCHAKAIGAINTLIPVRHLLEDGSIPDDLQLFKERNRSGPVQALYGENTDWIGVRACVRRGLSPANAVSPRTTALIVGAGGMARAAIYAMLQLGVRNIFIYNRTNSNAETLIKYFKGLLDDGTIRLATSVRARLPPDSQIHMQSIHSLQQTWPKNFRDPTIVVSCIPTHGIGENPSPDFTIPEQWLQSRTGGVVMEVAYRNVRTPLLDQIRAKSAQGWVTMDGLDLLPEQGFAQFELFTGRRAPRRLMRAEVLRNYRDEQGRPDPEATQWRLEHVGDQEP
ncbi:hypothetical protein E6O75_ATG04499 [Venturia nashicola]|uniref:Uncharacterized protein n=1 Tax=Venturia nashicola TaxID=86259 RepID=A0A4Z1PRM1_9PEZI|nr:hypothetical protein E6O75_ATG04499 [Venturia nashicola]